MGILVEHFDAPIHPQEVRERMQTIEERCAVLEEKNARYRQTVKMLMETTAFLLKEHNERHKSLS